MKKLLLLTLLLPLSASAVWFLPWTWDDVKPLQETLSADLRVITGPQGGTGIGTATAGDVGNCLKVADDSPFLTYLFDTCGAGGGGSGNSKWATTTGLTITPNGGGGILVVSSSTISDLKVTNGTTTNATSTTLHISSVFNFGGDVFDELVGTGLQIVNGDLQTTLGVAVDTTEITNSTILPADFADSDWGDITIASNVASVEDDSHAHTGATISGIDISDDTNLTGGLGLTLTGDDMACDVGSASVFGCISTTDWSTFNSKLGSYDAWTHPQAGVSATTSLMIFNNASSTFIGNLLIGGNSTSTNATTTADFSVNDDLNFYGEISPDGATCSNGEILKKAAADDWDCASDNNSGASFGKVMELIFGGDFLSATSSPYKSLVVGATTTASLDKSALFQVNATGTTGTIIKASSTPSFAGNFANFTNSAGTSLFKVDNAGLLTTTGFISTASSTVGGDLNITGNSTSTNATSTNQAISNLFTFNGVTSATWAGFCTTITGGAGLCDGTDATGGASFGKTLELVSVGDFLSATSSPYISFVVGATTTPSLNKSSLFQVNATGTVGNLISASSTTSFAGKFLTFNGANGGELFQINSSGGLIANASSTVIGNLNITGNSTSTNATTTGDFQTAGNLLFQGELMPDSAVCSNGEILKKTAANDWDCAADANSGGAAGGKVLDLIVAGDFLSPTSSPLKSFAIGVTTTPSLDRSALFQVNATGTTGTLLKASSTAGFAGKFLSFTTSAGAELMNVDSAGILTNNASIALDTNGVTFDTDGDGALTILGASTGADESIIFNLDDTADDIVITSGSSAATTTFSVLDIETQGLQIGASGVYLRDDGDGALSFLGTSAGADERWTINLDDTANEAVVNSDTGVATTTFSSMALEAIGLQVDTKTTGVWIDTDGDGALVLRGTSNGSDEDLSINLDDTSNEIDFTSTTGVVTADWNTMALATPLGAVGTPGFTFTGDLNTGMWSPAADTVAFSTAGVERLRMNLGNSGFGTTTSRWLLQLATSTAPQLTLSDGSLTSDHWSFRNTGGTLYLATSSPSTFATSSIAALQINSTGAPGLSIGSTTPFATLAVNPTAGGFNSKFVVGSSSATSFIVANNGNVGIGTAIPTSKFSINGGNGQLQMSADTDGGEYNIFTSNGTQTLALYGSAGNILNVSVLDGTFTAAASVVFSGLAVATNDNAVCIDAASKVIEDSGGLTCALSSIKAKKDIEILRSGLEKVIALNPVSFTYKDNGKQHYGLIAEEVAKVDPLFAEYAQKDITLEDGSVIKEGEPRSLDDRSILSAVVSAIQELWKKVAGTETRVEKLEKENAELKARLDTLEAKLK